MGNQSQKSVFNKLLYWIFTINVLALIGKLISIQNQIPQTSPLGSGRPIFIFIFLIFFFFPWFFLTLSETGLLRKNKDVSTSSQSIKKPEEKIFRWFLIISVSIGFFCLDVFLFLIF